MNLHKNQLKNTMKAKHSRTSDSKSAAAKPVKGSKGSKSSSSALASAADAARARLSKTLASSSVSKAGKKSVSTSPNAIAALAKSASTSSTGASSEPSKSGSRHSRAKTTEVAQALDAAFDAIVMTQLVAPSDSASSAARHHQRGFPATRFVHVTWPRNNNLRSVSGHKPVWQKVWIQPWTSWQISCRCEKIGIGRRLLYL
ncbi:hypothetical protein BCR44DRAFT_1486640 [Catenaria anguillulae PL171]|uniref:Uncharacterized protein n=1 Tax=Catenaria anguillulae PL171 TaxID=765915 RepID=A0A1Y2HFT8_9FUNG|nr:hypothetical protein BCR44DRAFT_1486640 [Catenaria anguillulae PL171]